MQVFASGSVGAINGLVFKNNILIGDNTVGGGSGFGIEIRQYVSNLEIYNNTLYGFPGGINLDFNTSGIENIAIKNNIFYNITNKDIDVDPNFATVVLIQNNLYESNPSIEDDFDSNPIVGNPKFVNAAAQDFHLQPPSAAIDSGLTISNVTKDHDYISRPQGCCYDIGAYEYISEEPQPDTTPPEPPSGVRVE